MTGKVSLPALLLLLVSLAFGTFNGPSAHGDEQEYSDPGYGMEYPMESEGMDEYCPGCGMMGNHGAMGGYGMGPGMMGGHGMMRGYGMGPGMMGGHGMMRGYGMGPGMIGGHGMMRGYGMGPGMAGGQGMMGGGIMYGLELDGEQRKQLHRIQSELRKHNWDLQGRIMDQEDKLFDLYADQMPDPKKIGSVYGKIFDLRRQMIEAAIEAQNRQRAILTDEQRRQLRNGGHRHSHEHHRSRPEGMGPGHDGQMMGG